MARPSRQIWRGIHVAETDSPGRLCVVRLLVTLDTNQLDDHQVQDLRASVSIPTEFACVTVNRRERGEAFVSMIVIPETAVWDESRWGDAVWGGPIPELLLLDETPLGSGVLAGEDEVDVFERALAIISDGSFPKRGRRDAMTKGELRQLRDAMTFEAHVRHRRHVLVTADLKGFINDGRRQRLEHLGRTRVLSPDEFKELGSDGRLAKLLPRR